MRFTIVVAGVIVESGIAEGSLELASYTSSSATITVVARLIGYEDNSVSLEYIL